MISGPLMYLIGTYFEKKRGMATGIAVAGCSVGGLVLAPLCRYLLNEYGLSGALLIIGGLMFHTIPAGALMRPEEFYIIKKKKKRKKNNSENDKNNSKNEPLLEDSSDIPLPFRPRAATTDSTFSPLARQVMLKRMRSRTESESQDDSYLEHDRTKSTSFIPPDVVQDTESNKKEVPKALLPPKLSRYFSNESLISVTYASIGSKSNVNETKSSHKTSESYFSKLFNFKLLKNINLLLFLLSYGFAAIGATLPLSYLPALATDRGIDPSKIAFLLSIASASDTVGRAVIGTFSDIFKIQPRYLMLTSVIIGGILHNLVMFIDIYWEFVLYAIVYGFFGGFNYALFTVILIDIVNFDNLKSALALIYLTEGIGFGIANPIIGEFYAFFIPF